MSPPGKHIILTYCSLMLADVAACATITWDGKDGVPRREIVW